MQYNISIDHGEFIYIWKPVNKSRGMLELSLNEREKEIRLPILYNIICKTKGGKMIWNINIIFLVCEKVKRKAIVAGLFEEPRAESNYAFSVINMFYYNSGIDYSLRKEIGSIVWEDMIYGDDAVTILSNGKDTFDIPTRVLQTIMVYIESKL